MTESTDIDKSGKRKYTKPAYKSDYDSPWKELIEKFFPNFVRFFLPDIIDDIDWDKGVEFIDKELIKITQDAEIGKRHADKLIKVWLLNGTVARIMIHIEVEGKQEPDFNERMFQYFYRIRDRYNTKVFSFAILTDSNKQFRPDHFKEKQWGCDVRFNFPCVKLIDYTNNWKQLEKDNNVFSIVVMAHLKSIELKDGLSRLEWKEKIVEELYNRNYDRDTIVQLFVFIDWLITLPKDLVGSFAKTIERIEEDNDVQYVTSIEKLGMQKGEAIALLRLMEKKFGSPVPELRTRIESADSETLLTWLDNILTAEKPDDIFH